MNYLGHVLDHLRKDLRLEWRSRDSINGMLFFALLVVVVFCHRLRPHRLPHHHPSDLRRHPLGRASSSPPSPRSTSPGPASSATRSSKPSAWPPPPPPRSSSAKPSPTCSSSLWSKLVLAPIFIIFFNLHVLGNAWLLALILPLGTWALVVNGTFFAALGLRARNRELLLPLLLFPISLPALLVMVQATTGVLTADLDPIQIRTWITQLAGYDIIYTTVCILLFETVLNAE